MPMFLLFLVVLANIMFVSISAQQPWMDTSLSPSQRTDLLLQQMNTTEKLAMLHGSPQGSSYVGFVVGNARLGIPELRLNDGPQGYRDDARPGTTTAFPSAMTVGTTFDRELMYKYGAAMGQEFFRKGANVQLGPGVNVARVPVNGRNFEYISGEDPFLGHEMVQPLVKGIQDQNVIANAKHWVENNQEIDRDSVTATVSERTRQEIYYPPFLGAVEAGVGSFMCSYNKIDTGSGSKYSCENEVTLKQDLKGHLGYAGWVMSDWGATHSTSINQGLDQEMPGMDFFGDKLQAMVDSGEVTMATIDNSVKRILTPMFAVGLFDTVNNNTVTNIVTTDENIALVRELSSASHVLLKNDNNILPLPKAVKRGDKYKIALIGHHARAPIIGGGGSGSVFPAKISTPYQGILDALGIEDRFKTSYNCKVDRTENSGFGQWGCESWPANSIEECEQACGNYPSCTHFSWSGSSCGLYPTNDNIIYSKGATSGRCIKTQPPSTYQCNQNNVCVAFIDGTDLDKSAELAKEANVAIVNIATYATEAHDRENLQFTKTAEKSPQCPLAAPNQDNLVSVIAATGTPTIVAATAPGAVLTSWRDSVKGILLGFFPGQEYGNALADILFGNVNPSARLSMTLPNVENEVGFTPNMYPGVKKQEFYSEELLVGYRWYHAKNIKPAYAFGHGLSYTTFKYSDVSITYTPYEATATSLYSVSVSVTNSGSRSGAEVAQLYICFPEAANEAPKQLKGFQKTSLLASGSSQTVTFVLKERDLSIWDENAHAWALVKGTFGVHVGASSSDIKYSGSITVV